MHELRQKAPKQTAVSKMETYLSEVYTKIKKGEKFSLDQLARDNQLSGTSATLLKREGIVQKIGKGREGLWSWSGRMPDEDLALQVVDAINVYSGSFKKSRLNNANLAQDQREIAPGSNDIAEAIASLRAPLNAKLISRAFRGSANADLDLFSSARSFQEEKIFISGAIASAVYSTFQNPTEFVKQSADNIQDINEAIVRASNDLLNKLISFKTVKK